MPVHRPPHPFVPPPPSGRTAHATDASSRSRRSAPRRGLLAVLGATAAALACDDGGTAPARPSSVSLSVAMAGAPVPSPTPRWTDGVHELVLERVALVVEEVAVVAGSDGEALESGPFVLEVPLGGEVRSFVAGAVRPGRYDQVRLALHAPRAADPGDRTFLDLHPSFEGVSVRVEGRWDGAPFVYARALDDLRLLALDPPLEVQGRTANVTVGLDVASWFRAGDGTLVDPSEAVDDGPAAAGVDARIRDSFVAYEDEDVDGVAGSG